MPWSRTPEGRDHQQATASHRARRSSSSAGLGLRGRTGHFLPIPSRFCRADRKPRILSVFAALYGLNYGLTLACSPCHVHRPAEVSSILIYLCTEPIARHRAAAPARGDRPRPGLQRGRVDRRHHREPARRRPSPPPRSSSSTTARRTTRREVARSYGVTVIRPPANTGLEGRRPELRAADRGDGVYDGDRRATPSSRPTPSQRFSR